MNRWNRQNRRRWRIGTKTENALFSVTVDEKKQDSVIPAVREIIGRRKLYVGYCGDLGSGSGNTS